MKHLTQYSSQNNLRRNHSRKLGYKQSGASLIISLILLGVMTLVGVGTMNNSIVQEKLAGNFEAGVGAMQNAETGINDTIAVIEANFTAAQIDLLLSDANNLQVLNDNAGSIFYSVDIIDNDDGDGDLLADNDGQFLLNSTGTLRGAVRNVLVRVSLLDGNRDVSKAILTEEPLTMSGRTRIDGNLNDIHSNGALLVGNTTGSTTETHIDSGHVSSHLDVTGTDKIQGTYDSFAAIEDVPDIIPSDFIDLADYILNDDGTITDTATGLSVSPISDYGWKYESGGDGKWKSDSSSITEGLYYSETNIHIDKSIGSSGASWNGGFLAEGSIEISGQFHIDASGYNDLMFLTADDIKLNGSGNATGKGLIGAQGQFNISGEVSIEGFLISKGENDDGGLVTENKISGQLRLLHDDAGSPFGGGLAGVQRLSWQQTLGT